MGMMGSKKAIVTEHFEMVIHDDCNMIIVMLDSFIDGDRSMVIYDGVYYENYHSIFTMMNHD